MRKTRVHPTTLINLNGVNAAIDTIIVPHIILLNKHHIKTTFCCQGEGLAEAYVQFVATRRSRQFCDNLYTIIMRKRQPYPVYGLSFESHTQFPDIRVYCVRWSPLSHKSVYKLFQKALKLLTDK